MPTNSRVPWQVCALAVLLSWSIGGTLTFAQETTSGAAAKQLTEALDGLKMDSIAAADPSSPDTFVAALYFPGAQLLVVSAQYSAPTLLAARLANKEYREAYIDLNSASVPGTKIFVMDAGADGLVARPEEFRGADTWERGATTMTFDGDWRSAKLTEPEYMKRFAEADAQYARMLSVLTERAKGGS